MQPEPTPSEVSEQDDVFPEGGATTEVDAPGAVGAPVGSASIEADGTTEDGVPVVPAVDVDAIEEVTGDTTALVQVEPETTPPGMDQWLLGGGSVLIAVFVGALLLFTRRTATPTDVVEPAQIPQTVANEPEATLHPVPVHVSMVDRLRERMSSTRDALQGRIDSLFGRAESHDELFEGLEEILLMADVGVTTSHRLIDGLRSEVKAGNTDPAALRVSLNGEIRRLLSSVAGKLTAPTSTPWVIMVVGVNGSGKTTTIGKLAARLNAEGKSVILAAADTYRAAAADQLAVWAERAGADLVRMDEGADPGAVVHNAMETAVARGTDVVIVDTAGRLQTRKPLMQQLTKMRKVISKKVPDGPHETLLVLDGTMGQNALSQAMKFNEATPLTGVIVTKLDGTAKGGMLLTIASEMGLPVKLIGIGEGVEDLRDFDAESFVEALA